MRNLEEILTRVQKPSRYTGGELNSIVKEKKPGMARFAFCFPDTYEVGMSNLGMKILYHVMNEDPDVWCERVFAPWDDMEAEMRAAGLPLYALESKDPVRDFDFIGFTLQTELSYTNILNMLDLAGVPIRSADRHALTPIVVAGGSCGYNPEPLADFIDIFIMGEGEEVDLELIHLYRRMRDAGADKQSFLRAAAQIPGIYVPALYAVSYQADGTIASFAPVEAGVPETVKKRIMPDLNRSPYPDKFILPFCDIVHDRIMLELFRGCIRGCRFCQAGFIYRPVREKEIDLLDEQARKLIASTGYDEISMMSLSTSDYTELEPLADRLLSWCEPKKVSLSLPSLRVDNFSTELMDRVQKVRKGSLTFAPEAGTQRMRDVINKNVTEEELIRTCKIAFRGGYTGIKLYFMIGLPGETDEDVLGIADLAYKVVQAYYECDLPKGGRSVNVSVSVSSFVPKPFTPFQWAPQDTMEELARKQKLLRDAIKSRKISLHWHDKEISFLEAVFARGDRRLCPVIEQAWRDGCKFDNWDTSLRFPAWMAAFEKCGVDPAFFATRERKEDEILPWDFVDISVSKRFFLAEKAKAARAETTPNCREKCSGCGANALIGGPCK